MSTELLTLVLRVWCECTPFAPVFDCHDHCPTACTLLPIWTSAVQLPFGQWLRPTLIPLGKSAGPKAHNLTYCCKFCFIARILAVKRNTQTRCPLCSFQSGGKKRFLKHKEELNLATLLFRTFFKAMSLIKHKDNCTFHSFPIGCPATHRC